MSRDAPARRSVERSAVDFFSAGRPELPHDWRPTVHTGIIARPTTARLGASRRALGCVTVLVGLLVGMALMAGPALALPAGRVYEMVSPLYKGGYGANSILAVAPDGESVAFVSQGRFSGAPSNPFENFYIARRSPAGWSTSGLMVPTPVLPAAQGDPLDLSTDLGTALYFGWAGEYAGIAAHEKTEVMLLMHRTETPETPENFYQIGSLARIDRQPVNPRYDGSSVDFSHIFFSSDGTEALLPGGAMHGKQLYDLANGHLELVGVDDNGELVDGNCETTLGSPFLGSRSLNAIATDGSKVFFTANTNLAAGAKCDGSNETVPSNPGRVFVRVGAQSTLLLSTPLAAVCSSQSLCHESAPQRAVFQGADESSTCAFFTTSQPLVSGDTDDGSDLYMARVGRAGEAEGLGCEPAVEGRGAPAVTSLVQVSRDPHAGQAAEVLGTVALGPDGSHVYFVARGALTEEADAEGRSPTRGADNLYVYERDERYPSGRLAFVADLCSGPGISGESPDVSCPASVPKEMGSDTTLWSGAPPAQIAGDGRFLFFSTYAQLRPGDAATALHIYRYDAVTGSLIRVSIGEAGYDANGNNDAFGVTLTQEDLGGNVDAKMGIRTRQVSEDGSRAVFTTAEPLSPAAVNGLVNAYEWHIEPGEAEGRVSLLSTGTANEPVDDVVMSQDGRDVFFVTSQGLVPQDTDGAPDVYDARLGGGFPAAPAEPQPCSGDACQGPLTNPAPLLVPGSVPQEAGGNFPAPAPATTATPKKKASVRCAKGKRRGHGTCVKDRGKQKAIKTKRAAKASENGRAGR
jgi:hypothetical protein